MYVEYQQIKKRVISEYLSGKMLLGEFAAWYNILIMENERADTPPSWATEMIMVCYWIWFINCDARSIAQNIAFLADCLNNI